jgi:hypothetical protein
VRAAGEALHKRALPGLPGTDQHHGGRIAEGREEAGSDGARDGVDDQSSAVQSLYAHRVVDP